jgi:hypothetical protein
LRITWDPADVVHGGLAEDPVRTGCPAVAPHVANVHVKDARVEGDRAEWTQMGEGVVDWPGQLGQLQRSGYAGFLTLEPHLQYEPDITGSAKMTEDLVARCGRCSARRVRSRGSLGSPAGAARAIVRGAGRARTSPARQHRSRVARHIGQSAYPDCRRSLLKSESGALEAEAWRFVRAA